jgi:Zn-dependent peptidase ImmA (M78 family)
VTQASQLSYDAIREYAELIGRHHGIYNAAGRADIDGLLSRLGGRVAYHDSSESMHVRSAADFVVFLPSFTSARRDRFTIAHELGHYFLHYLHPQLEGFAPFQRGGQSLAETQANVFAASLLMPEAEFRVAHQATDGDKWRLAQVFDVSPAAAEVRAQVLNLA